MNHPKKKLWKPRAGDIAHVIFRGIDGHTIFNSRDDYEWALHRIGSLLQETKTSCFAFALMPNHVHMVLRVSERVSLETFMRRLEIPLSMRHNRRLGRRGHALQDRYLRIEVEGQEHVRDVVRYVVLNPLRAGLVPTIEALREYPWASFPDILGARTGILARRAILPFFENDPEVFEGFLQSTDIDVASIEEAIRKAALEQRDRGNRRRARPAPPSRESFLSLVQASAVRCGVSPASVLAGERFREATLARAQLIRSASSELGMSPSAIARQLGISRSAVSRVLRRSLDHQSIVALELTA